MIIHPEVKNWIKYAKFEQKHNYINSARTIYERAVEFFGEENMNEGLLIAFARFEEAQKEVCTSAWLTLCIVMPQLEWFPVCVFDNA